MEEGTLMGDVPMEDLVEQSGALASARQRDSYNSESLLAPEADFMIDDHNSHNSGMEVTDRLTYLEQRIQMQEDEIQLLKMAMADVLKRLNISEEQTAALTKRGPVKAARPASLVLSPRVAPSTSVSSLRKSSSSTLPSSPSSKNYSPSPASKRTPVGTAKDSPSSKSQTTTTTTTCKKSLETKPKETSTSTAGTRRVTHCKDLSEPPVKKDWIF